MDNDRLLQRSIDLLRDVESIQESGTITQFQVNKLAAQVSNLIHAVLGPKSSYAESLRSALKVKGLVRNQFHAVAGVIQALHLDISSGNLINLRQEIEAIVVTEIVNQSRKLLGTKGIHPATSIVVACAGVEEFLRSWCEQKNITIATKQRSLSKYAKELRAAGEFALPIERRIQSWADYRNQAAHGSKWDEITKTIAEKLVGEIEDFIVENHQIVGG